VNSLLPETSFGTAQAGALGEKRRKPVSLPPARLSSKLLIRIEPHAVGLFRYLLEGSDNLALFSVLDSRAALLKLLFSPHQREEVRRALDGMRALVPFAAREWHFS
jgi:hypothetical protein